MMKRLTGALIPLLLAACAATGDYVVCDDAVQDCGETVPVEVE
jgi:hypothetical protein